MNGRRYAALLAAVFGGTLLLTVTVVTLAALVYSLTHGGQGAVVYTALLVAVVGAWVVIGLIARRALRVRAGSAPAAGRRRPAGD